MIRYPDAKFHPKLLFQTLGSPFPFSFCAAFPCGLLSALLSYLWSEEVGDAAHFFSAILSNNAGYTSFTFLVGFLVVFRTQQGYGRFCDGLSNLKAMQSEWYSAASNLVAFSRHSTSAERDIKKFHHVIVRLLSMLDAVALAQLEGQDDEDEMPVAFTLRLIDVKGLDAESLEAVRRGSCQVEMILQWIQSITVHNIKSGILSIPPPILARVFHNLSNGMASFHQAKKLCDVPYPFPFMQATEWLLVLHWLITPMVMVSFTHSPLWAGIFSFLATLLLWSLNCIAAEMENPFGSDSNDLHTVEMQEEWNLRLLTLLWPGSQRMPFLTDQATLEESSLHHPQSMLSLSEVWEVMQQTPSQVDRPKQRAGISVAVAGGPGRVSNAEFGRDNADEDASSHFSEEEETACVQRASKDALTQSAPDNVQGALRRPDGEKSETMTLAVSFREGSGLSFPTVCGSDDLQEASRTLDCMNDGDGVCKGVDADRGACARGAIGCAPSVTKFRNSPGSVLAVNHESTGADGEEVNSSTPNGEERHERTEWRLCSDATPPQQPRFVESDGSYPL